MSGIMAVMYREFKIRITSLTWLFYDILMPFAYLLLFGIGLDRAFSTGISVADTTMSYNAFFLPAVLAMACFGIAINTSYGFFVDRDNGIFYEMLTYPLTRGEFLVGKITFNCLTSLLQAVVAIGLGVLVLDIRIEWVYLPLLLGGVILGTAGWFFFLAIFALRIKRNDMFNTLINVLYFLVMFLSSMFYPIEGMPGWFRTLAYLNPITWQTDGLRYFALGVGTLETILLEIFAFTLFTLAGFFGAIRALKSTA